MTVSNDWRNQRSFLIRTFNPEVREWFRDVEDAVPDNSTSRGQALRACLILNNESQSRALIKMQTFYNVIQRSHLRPDVYGTPIGNFDAIRRYRPQIGLYFREDELDLEPGFAPVEGRISFRLMNETSETITRSELTTIANRVRTEFAANRGFVWRKGKDLATYTDPDRGFGLKLLVRTQTEGEQLARRVLDLTNTNFEARKFNYKQNSAPTQAFPTLPPNQTILGRVTREPRRRPIASVRFQYAYCNLHGATEPTILIDRSFRFRNTLVS